MPIERKALKRKTKKQLIGMAEAMIGEALSDKIADKEGYENVTKADLVGWVLEAKGAPEEEDSPEAIVHPDSQVELEAMEEPANDGVLRKGVLGRVEKLAEKTVMVVHPAPVEETIVQSKSGKKKSGKEKGKKIDVKAQPKKKVPSKNALKAQMIRMAMLQLIDDAHKGEVEGIATDEDGMITVKSQLLVSRYALVKTYSKDRNAWNGSGSRDKETGVWEGHRHPAPRMLLELGFESLLERTEGGWRLCVLPLDTYHELYRA